VYNKRKNNNDSKEYLEMRLKVRGKLYDITKKEVEKRLFNVEPEIGRKYFVEI